MREQNLRKELVWYKIACILYNSSTLVLVLILFALANQLIPCTNHCASLTNLKLTYFNLALTFSTFSFLDFDLSSFFNEPPKLCERAYGIRNSLRVQKSLAFCIIYKASRADCHIRKYFYFNIKKIFWDIVKGPKG